MDPNSRDNSLAAPVHRALSKGNISSSATSVTSSDGHGDAGSDLQSSGDGVFDRRKSRGSEDANSETSSHRRKLSRMFKGRKGRRKSMQDDISPGELNQDVPPLPDVPIIRAPGDDPRFRSEESLGLHKSVPSSLLIEDSDTESSPVRPGISPHPSHAGYLTLSSPLINSETLDSVAQSEATLIDSIASSEEPPTPRHAQTIDVASAKRGTSPVNKLKEAFVPARRSTAPKPPSDTVEAARPSTSGGLGVLFGGKKRDTRLVDDSELQASPPQIHDNRDTQSTSSLPKPGPQRIFTQIPATPPNLIDAPTTLVTPPTPTDVRPASPASTSSVKNGGKHGSAQSNPNVVVSPSGNMISHRRARSATNPPSKLSNSIAAPLTPTIEEAKTPGGTAVPPQSPSGFFSSVFSAAQNAANTLGTTIANSANQTKNKSTTQPKSDDKRAEETGGEEVIGPDNAQPTDSASTEKRKLAVETLGTGNLSLAHLGISDSSDPSPMSSATHLPLKADEASARAADMAAAQAVSAAYAAEPSTAVNGDRPRSLTTNSGLTTASAGAMSPPRQTEVSDSPAPASIQRQGSIRSRISGGRRRRHRGSSATTGNTIAAAIGASTHTLAPQASLSGQRLNGTGFAVASSKRNKDFHALFKSVPEDDYLIEDYSAALQKEILLQGRLYVSEGHLCFSSNILGWVTNLVISFDEVVSVEKKSTAVVFPNAIVIQTLHARNVFASFLTRDSTYDLIIGIWKISHPNLKSSLNGVALDGSGTGDKTEKAESVVSDEGSDQDSEDEVYDEDEEEDGIGSFTEAGEGSIAGSEQESIHGESRKPSASIAHAVSGGSAKLVDPAEVVANAAPTAQDYPGAATHAPTDCGDNDQHYDKLLIDTTIPAPLGKVYSLMFGPASGAFMKKWLVEDQKSTDLQLEDDGKGLDDNHKAMTFSYTKPLGGGIGPSKTRCNINSTLEQYNLEKAVTVLCSTQTPDVPSGNVFLVKTRYCLMWGPNNSTRIIMTFAVEWSGKSWLKGPIEKGANDGQMTYATALSAALRTAVVRNAAPKAAGKGGKGKKRSKNQISDEAAVPIPAATPAAAQPKEPSWGPLDPLRSLFPGPLVSIIDLLFTTQNIILILGALLIYTWFFRSSASHVGPHTHLSTAQRQVAYEQIWRSEEAELWKWLEERVALDRVHSSVTSGGVLQGQEIQSRLVAEGMKERQIDEAIKTTEERLRALKGAVRRERETGTRSPREEQT
ncbi:uncharacterized protein N0V89_004457 [Didymosphaeria variabile]|uniref:VASt domain-containing protein n=1 Tax=Didymosphaeria variabile TaxID=1932322 RepID=A0A9W9CCF1_9PLEO|nr:uncharacterized protein N0V89_004457 [Didymosphaeria variabile]KAJ4356424.1 hypothetical protein N0V89_004457 [Didymosphaeria variabile]